MNELIFRENDIRGIVGIDLTTESVTILAKAVGTHFVNCGVRKLCIGYDARESSPQFCDIISKQLAETGLDVTIIGMVPTPLLYFSLFHENVDAGIMITGSHNPKEFNGFKICRDFSSIYGDEIQAIKELAISGEFAVGSGIIITKSIDNEYIEFVKKGINLGNRKLKVVIDAGNGVGGIIGAPLYREIGCETIELFIEPDCNFPNHHPDPTVLENMESAIASVLENRADLAIAFDGDGDRIGVIDEKGNVIWGDQLMTIFARSILQTNPAATFIGEVKCSQTLFDDIEKHGGTAVMSKVGHSLIKAKMKETGALLAGEMSGHIFFADRYYGYDDAMYAGARLLEILSNTSLNLSDFLADLPICINTPEIRIDCPDEIKFEVVAQITKEFSNTHKVFDIDGARIIFDNGWGLVRASNTQAVIVMRFEATDAVQLDKIRKTIENQTTEKIAALLKKAAAQ